MTERKEIIEMLKVLKEQALKSHNDTAIIDVKKDSFIYVMNVAINSLEIDERYELEYENAEDIHREKEQAYMQGYEDACKKYRKEPCEDAISRQAVLDIINFEDKWLFDAKGHNADTKIAFSGMKSSVLALPPVNPQEPKTGQWIKISPANIFECSECGQNVMTEDICVYKYCPNCGTKMVEEVQDDK